MELVEPKRHVGRPAKRRVVRVTPKIQVHAKAGEIDRERAATLEYERKPGKGYMHLSRFIDAVIAASREDEYVTSSYMKVGV